ncbi:DALR anticodon-binding domain-containing protein [Streptomyces sp. FXJ1.172]|uniref:ArgS-related anticodon-binding protein NrtL n=1 Tax=Streptomyces sp. FXJ1.172 TaxID=710705 RepID=UPI0007CF8653|nr:DALR anticodon-binding domain-containing protein [Streptomyces sp. FXJ1.172]WEO95297.1 DALR anticodon-binding domain-containing protein [Streptomyces sp. FXJ1.172]
MTPVELSRTVLHAVRRAVDDGELSVAVPERAVVSEPGPGGCGDYATTIALQLARPAGQPARRVAEILLPRLADAAGIREVVVTGPGFLNISLAEQAQADLVTAVVREIRARGAAYGHGDALAGQVVALRVPYEVRAEVVADAVVRLVAAQGGRATVEHAEPVTLRPVPAPEDPAPLGPDAAQWALLHPAPHDRPRITADHLVQRESNPLFRVRYAHARVRSVSRNAARLGFSAEPGPIEPAIDTGTRSSTSTDGGNDAVVVSRDLLTPLADHPRILAAAATHRAPDRLARHLVTVADAVLPFLPSVLPSGEEKPSAAHRARLALAEAAGTVLAGGLSLLGIDAPEHL